MKRYIVTSFVLALLLLFSFSYPQQFSESGGVAGQRRSPRRNVRSNQPRKPAIDYSRFSHATKEHQESCKTCHKAPTANWKKASDFPDIADFPDHDACVRCHRAQFFKTAQPAICTNCHQKTSPRDSARFEFRNAVRSRQFAIEFPHDKHQDVIARRESLAPPHVTQTVSLRSLAHSRSITCLRQRKLTVCVTTTARYVIKRIRSRRRRLILGGPMGLCLQRTCSRPCLIVTPPVLTATGKARNRPRTVAKAATNSRSLIFPQVFPSESLCGLLMHVSNT